MAEERRFEQGQRLHGAFSHRTLNTMLELTRQQRLDRLGDQGGDASEHTLGPGVEVLVQNQTGTFQPVGSVLSLMQGTPLDPSGEPMDFLARPCFYGTVPLATADLVGVLRDGLADGETGLATVEGIAVITLDWTDLTHQYAQPVANDSSQMASAGAGHRILWTETAARGQQDAVILLTLTSGLVVSGYDGLVNLADVSYTPTTLNVINQRDESGDDSGVYVWLGTNSAGNVVVNLEIEFGTATNGGLLSLSAQTLKGLKTFADGLAIAAGKNIQLDVTTGTKIATNALQLLGFWGATPVSQPNGTGETVGFTAGVGSTVHDDSTFTGHVGSTAYRISDIVKALKQAGLLAS